MFEAAILQMCSATSVAHMFCRQARKLQEMFQKVQQENEMLRGGRRPGNAVQMGSGSRQQFNDLLSPAHNMRHQSNAPGSGRVVCLSALQMVHTWNCQQPGVLQHLCVLVYMVQQHTIVVGKCFMLSTSELCATN